MFASLTEADVVHLCIEGSKGLLSLLLFTVLFLLIPDQSVISKQRDPLMELRIASIFSTGLVMLSSDLSCHRGEC